MLMGKTYQAVEIDLADESNFLGVRLGVSTKLIDLLICWFEKLIVAVSRLDAVELLNIAIVLPLMLRLLPSGGCGDAHGELRYSILLECK